MESLTRQERHDRSRTRAWFLQVHYRWEAEGRGFTLERALSATLEGRRVSPRRLPYLERLVRVFADNRDQIDAAVASAMDNWRMDRLSFVDRSILRLGATEIICIAEVPGRVAIQEAVRLAQRYGGDDSSRFVNGVLDGVYRTVEDDSPAGRDDLPPIDYPPPERNRPPSHNDPRLADGPPPDNDLPPDDDGPRPKTIPRPKAGARQAPGPSP